MDILVEKSCCSWRDDKVEDVTTVTAQLSSTAAVQRSERGRGKQGKASELNTHTHNHDNEDKGGGLTESGSDERTNERTID